MKLSGLHILLTYQCTLECDHCFVWSSPWQSGVMSLGNLRGLLTQAKDLGTIDSIYFEGGEPFLYYGLLLAGTREAARQGFQVGVVSNGYWATSVDDALEWLRPFAGLLQDLSVSSDIYHWNAQLSQQSQYARAAAEQLGIPLGVISIAQPEVVNAASAAGQIPTGESTVMYRGRAAKKLAGRARPLRWTQFAECPHEDFREPGRIHVDPFGNVHICQGIALGNVFQTSLKEICETYDPDSHPIVGPLLAGGPAELTRRYEVSHADYYADACHLCDATRRMLRGRFPTLLMPDQMYGVPAG
jgi:MoaA/NifB/PqqE/SkfB family radical SAM enzyme